MQFPFMVCTDCRWKVREKEIDQQFYHARRYIAEHPDERDQLQMVLDSVMEEKNLQRQEKLDRSGIRKDINSRIRVYHIIFTFLVGILGLLYVGFFIAIGEPIPIFGAYCIAGLLVSLICLLAAPILLILKLNSLRE